MKYFQGFMILCLSLVHILARELSGFTPQPPYYQLKSMLSKNLKRTEIEPFTRVGDSHLWNLVSASYEYQGLEEDELTKASNFVYLNAFIATSYAHIIDGFLRDSVAVTGVMELDRSEPVYVVEIGGGSGKLAYLLLQSLLEKLASQDLPLHNIKYVLADTSKAAIEFWMTNSRLQSYVDKGILDFCLLTNDLDELMLIKSNLIIRRGSLQNPIIVIANYFLHRLGSDLFHIGNNVTTEALMSLGSNAEEEPNPNDITILKRLRNRFEYNDIHTTSYYLQAPSRRQLWNDILSWYRHYFERLKARTIVLFPRNALTLLEKLKAFASDRALVISSDKGFTRADYFEVEDDLGQSNEIDLQNLFLTNYHAISMTFRATGGVAECTSQLPQYLQTCIFISNGDKSKRRAETLAVYPATKGSMTMSILKFGPTEFLTSVSSIIERNQTSLHRLLALLKLSNWDADVFEWTSPQLSHVFDKSPFFQQQLLLEGLDQVWKNYYPVDAKDTIAMQIGSFFSRSGDCVKALEYFELYKRSIGVDAAYLFRASLCHDRLNHEDEASALLGELIEKHNNSIEVELLRKLYHEEK